jgi:phosphonate transport system ATP-binding protein
MSGLSLRSVSADYGGQRVLDPITLTIEAGEKVALVGRSGAGKSTLLSLLFDSERRDIAYMPQELGLVQALSVFHNVYMGRLAVNATWYNIANLVWPFKDEVAAVQAVLEPLGLTAKLWSPAGELSGGQRQRTAVARTIYQNADILLADEPVSALDGPQAHNVMGILTTNYATAVLAMHDVELALRYTNRVVGIDDGRIALDEPAERLTAEDLLPLYQGETA